MNLSQYRIPKKLKVGGLTYRIEFPHLFVENTGYLGLHILDDLVIRLGLFHNGIQINQQVLYATFIHEMLHAIDHIYCARSIDNEDIIDRLANGLYQVIVENKLQLKGDKLPKKLKILGFDVKVMYPFEFKDTDSSAFLSMSILDMKIEKKECIELAQLEMLGGIVALICDSMCIRLGGIEKGGEEITDPNAFLHLQQGLYQVMIDNDIEYIIRGK